MDTAIDTGTTLALAPDHEPEAEDVPVGYTPFNFSTALGSMDLWPLGNHF